jgi:hypothetical protein
MAEYVSYKLEKQFDKNVIVEAVNGLRSYFNTILNTKLLYKFEKQQYIEVIHFI